MKVAHKLKSAEQISKVNKFDFAITIFHVMPIARVDKHHDHKP